MINSLKWHYAPLRVNTFVVCGKLKVKVSIYFEISVFNFIINIVSTKLYDKNENIQVDFDTFDRQERKRVGQSFYTLTIFLL